MPGAAQRFVCLRAHKGCWGPCGSHIYIVYMFHDLLCPFQQLSYKQRYILHRHTRRTVDTLRVLHQEESSTETTE